VGVVTETVAEGVVTETVEELAAVQTVVEGRTVVGQAVSD
jgi:hypothetical protein